VRERGRGREDEGEEEGDSLVDDVRDENLRDEATTTTTTTTSTNSLMRQPRDGHGIETSREKGATFVFVSFIARDGVTIF
jgi:hypothetical protein